MPRASHGIVGARVQQNNASILKLTRKRRRPPHTQHTATAFEEEEEEERATCMVVGPAFGFWGGSPSAAVKSLSSSSLASSGSLFAARASSSSSSNSLLPRSSLVKSAFGVIMCAWFCSGRSNMELVNRLRSANVITSERVREVMLAVDRGNYAPDRPYDDSPQYLGFEQTISAPHMHAHALELLKDKLVPGASALDVGCGSGYLTACMGRLVAPGGHVHGIDIVPGLVAMSRENLLKSDGDLLEKGVVSLAATSGWEGAKEHGPYDAIHVGAAAASVPRQLVEQLKVGGIMVIPVGPEGGNQALYRIEKVKESGPVEETFVAHELMGVRYVPLVRGSPYAKK